MANRHGFAFAHPLLLSLFSWIILAALVIAPFAHRTTAWLQKTPPAVLTHPFSPDGHMTRAKILRNLANDDAANDEEKLGLWLASETKILGATSQSNTVEKLQEQFAYWDDISKTHQDFADAFLISGIYAYLLGDRQDAKKRVTIARSLNPIQENIDAISRIIR